LTIEDKMKILITGGGGYVGTSLIPKLLKQKYEVINLDTLWFGNYLPKSPLLKTVVGKFSDVNPIELNSIDHVIHLANVANDPSVDLNQSFAWEVNSLNHVQFMELLVKHSNIKSFIYASSGSVYGVNNSDKVSEDLDLVPISTYNKTKQVAERITLSYESKFKVHIIRPATICGVSPRMRFDVVVNMFVIQAFKNRKITVFGGDQVRPNIHMEDMAEVYLHFLKNYHLPNGFYNAGFENLRIVDIAKLVAQEFDIEFTVKPSNDPRSYRLDSSKLVATGYTPKKKVIDACREIYTALETGLLDDAPNFYNVNWMKSQNLDKFL